MRKLGLVAGAICLLSVGTVLPKAERHIWINEDIKEDYAEISQQYYGYQGHLFVHITGNGGDASGVEYLVNLFKTIKHVTIVVEGKVQSADAALAFAGDDVILPENGYLTFHLVSGTNMVPLICEENAGKLDRGLDAYAKCVEDETTVVDILNRELLELIGPHLTKEELARLMQGREVYVTNKEMKRRLDGHSRN